MGNIIKSLAMVVAVSAAVGGATVAYFSDTETSTGNAFAAGTLDLVVEGENPLTTAFNIDGIAPGDMGAYEVTVENAGDVDGDLEVSFANLMDNDNACIGPEADVDSTCGDNEGELSANTMVMVYALGDDPADTSVSPVYSGTMAGLVAASPIALGSLVGGDTNTFVLAASVDSNVGNIIQSDSAEFDITLELEQN